MPAAPRIPPPGTIGAKISNTVVAANVRLYRASGGRLGGKVKGAPVLMLDHVGRKSGKSRTTPVLYLEDGDDLVIVGSRGGSQAMPGWFFNLKASPRTSVQIGSEHRSVLAREATDEERERLWPALVEMFPDYDVYRRRTDRKIPVLILSPAP